MLFRSRALIAANDIGHIRGLRAMGATADEMASIRARDRRAQGVTEKDEAEARRAIAVAERKDALTIVRTASATSSAIGDFIEPELGGPGAENLLVVMPETLSFFGDGRVVRDLADEPGSWHGGALPARGFWGVAVTSPRERDRLIGRIRRSLARSP